MYSNPHVRINYIIFLSSFSNIIQIFVSVFLEIELLVFEEEKQGTQINTEK